MEEEYKFYQILKANSSQKKYEGNEYIDEWKFYKKFINKCGHIPNRKKNGNDSSDIDENNSDWEIYNSDNELINNKCKNCICGEKCLKYVYMINNIISNKKLIVGSVCIKKFIPKIHKEIKELRKKRKDAEKKAEKESKEAEKELQKSRCDDCLSLLNKFNNCYTCKYIKPEHKRKLKKDFFIKWVQDEANKKELTGYIKLLYNFIEIRKNNREYIDILKMKANFKDWIKNSVHEMILENPEILNDEEYNEI
jgi:hypothetical protein